jgi:glycine reductase
MSAIIDRMVVLGLKLASGDELSHADVDDYLPHGFRREIVREKPGAERAVDMALALALGQPITPEIKIREYDFVPAPAPIQNLKETTVALVTTAGLVPKGNPDGLQGGSAPRKLVSYDISDFNALTLGEWESVHGGFKGYIYNSVNPNYALPLPALRGLEALGAIKGVHKEFFSTAGASCPVTSAQEMGREIARRLVADGVEAVILEST